MRDPNILATDVSYFDWEFPCSFETLDDESPKDMWTYFMFYNITLTPSGKLLRNPGKPVEKDMSLIALKMGLDNALLEYKARELGLDWVPKIEQTV